MQSQQEKENKAKERAYRQMLASCMQNTIYIMCNVIETFTFNVQEILEPIGAYKFEIKKDLDTIRRLTKKHGDEVFKQLPLDQQLLFGEDTEEVYKIVSDWLYREIIDKIKIESK